MSTSEERIKIFEGTRQLCRSSEVLVGAIEKSKREQKIYWEDDAVEQVEPRFSDAAGIVISPNKTLEASRKYAEAGDRVCILNFASAVSPGGGVVKGAQAQEECICRQSTLYFALSDPETAGKFYDYHWSLINKDGMSRRNSDDIIFTPGVVVVRDEAKAEKLMDKDEWYSVDVITCAAPDIREIGDSSEYRPDAAELQRVFEIRWKKILAVATKHKADVLILGAFGCGVFANPPEIVVSAINNVIGEFKYHFKTIEFAVYTTDKESRNYKAFGNIKFNEERGENK